MFYIKYYFFFITKLKSKKSIFCMQNTDLLCFKKSIINPKKFKKNLFKLISKISPFFKRNKFIDSGLAIQSIETHNQKY